MTWHIETAARTLWQEARGEPLSGQQAVAHVFWNRVRDGRWGDTLFEVCMSEYKGIHQFSGWNRSDPNRVPASRLADDDALLITLTGVVEAAETAPDPTGGATHYERKGVEGTSWVDGDPAHGIPAATFCGQFGNQLFYKNVR